MSLFNKVLQNINKKIEDDKSYKKEIILKIQEVSNIKLKEDMFTIKNKTLIIKSSPTIKMEILLKKELLIEKLNEFNIINLQ